MDRAVHRYGWMGLLLATLIVSLMGPSSAQAHPHVWVDYAIEARFDAEGLVGFHHHWTFDEMFSSQLMEMFDADGDGVFSPEEVQAVRRGAFEYLSEYDYFIQIKIDKTPFHVASVTDFHAAIHGYQVVYDFFIPCRVPATTEPQPVHLLVADMEYFVDLDLHDDGLTIKGQEYVSVTTAFHSSEAFSFWGGAWEPRHLTLIFHSAS